VSVALVEAMRNVALLATLLLGCTTEPAAPAVNGTVALSGAPTGFDTLVTLLTAVHPGEGFSYFPEEQALPATWPATFYAGGGLGVPPDTSFTLSAWLATQPGTTAPEAGAPHATMDLQFHCTQDGCSAIDGLSLTLAP
jgi:hypothetical protein